MRKNSHYSRALYKGRSNMRRIIILLLTVLMISASAYGQTDKRKKAYELGMEAIKEMGAGNIEKAIKLLEQSSSMIPN